MGFDEVLKQAELAREEQDKFAQAQQEKRAAELKSWRDRLERRKRRSDDASDGFELPPENLNSFINPDINPDDYVSMAQAAQELGIEKTSVCNHIRLKKISATKYHQKGKKFCWLIHKDELERVKMMPRPDSKNPVYPSGYIGTKEALEKLGITYNMLWVEIKKGKIQAQKYGNLWIMKAESVREYLENKRGFKVKSSGKK